MPSTCKDISPIDIAVGARIRGRRKTLGMSQSTLADGIGVTFQQVQKYEKGSNRVGSSRLQHIAKVLSTTPSALFGEVPPGTAGSMPELNVIEHLLGTSDVLALNKAFVNITDAGIRKSIIALVKSLTNNPLLED